MTASIRGVIGIGVLAFVLGSGAGPLRAASVTVDDFSDIGFWAGTGAHEAALVLQFPTVAGGMTLEPAAVAWGYRWDGAATFESLLFALAGHIVGGPAAVAGSDPRLAIDVTYYGGNLGYFVEEIAYDQTGLGIGWSPGVRTIGPYDPATGEYPAQYQRDNSGGVWTTAPFDVSAVGISSTALFPGGWYAFVQADGLANTLSLSQPVSPVPEPSAIALAGAGAIAAWAVAARRLKRG
jgi:hypothetical protein